MSRFPGPVLPRSALVRPDQPIAPPSREFTEGACPDAPPKSSPSPRWYGPTGPSTASEAGRDSLLDRFAPAIPGTYAPPLSPLFAMVRPDKPIANSREGETASWVHRGSRGRAAAGGLRAAAGAGPGFSGSDAPPPSGGGAQPWPQVTPGRGPLWMRREVRALR